MCEGAVATPLFAVKVLVGVGEVVEAVVKGFGC